MVVATLQAAITKIFSDMNDMTSGGNKYCADELAGAIKDYIDSGVVTSTDDAGTIGTNTYKGSGVGKMEIDESKLASKLLETFTKENLTDADLADGLASNLDDICSKKDSVTTTTTGMQTTPSGVSTPYVGSGIGTFQGIKSVISESLKTAFSAMGVMLTGGNEVFSAALATSINTYLTSGSINITLQLPITGIATGKIA